MSLNDPVREHYALQNKANCRQRQRVIGEMAGSIVSEKSQGGCA